MNDNGLFNGGPAFPVFEDVERFEDDLGKYVPHLVPQGGMSLRHWTATQALPVSMSMLQMMAAMGNRVDLNPVIIAKNALLIADALIAEQRLVSAPPKETK